MQEDCGFLTPRGKKERGTSSQKKRDKGQSTGTSTSQRGTYSINRAVMVGSSIQPDSNASDTKKRRYTLPRAKVKMRVHLFSVA